MTDLVRFSVSVESNLLDGFGHLLAAEGCASRSDANRGLIRLDAMDDFV